MKYGIFKQVHTYLTESDHADLKSRIGKVPVSVFLRKIIKEYIGSTTTSSTKEISTIKPSTTEQKPIKPSTTIIKTKEDIDLDAPYNLSKEHTARRSKFARIRRK